MDVKKSPASAGFLHARAAGTEVRNDSPELVPRWNGPDFPILDSRKN